MKYVIVQAAFKLPDSFDIEKGDLNDALDYLVSYRMARDKITKAKKHSDGPGKAWKTIPEMFQIFWNEVNTTDNRLVASFGFDEVAEVPKRLLRRPALAR